jgi:hypothetical protein
MQISKILSVMPNASLWSRLFGALTIAEEEIAAARLPKKLSSTVFLAVVPPPIFEGKTDALYRSHVRELIARVKSGADLSLGTDAECLCAMLEVATQAPLTPSGNAVAHELFRRVFPKRAADMDATDGGIVRETWAGQVDEDITAMRRKLRVQRNAGL